MHDAYEILPVLERLPLIIESIACYGENCQKIQPEADSLFHPKSRNNVTLLVGTKPGHLLVYKVQREVRNTGSHIDVTLEKSNRSFSKRPIQQLFVSAELKILISLSDGNVTVHDLFSYQTITTLQKAKGASLFAADLEEQISSAGEVAYELKLCVVVKRKLQFYFWKNRDFCELHGDIAIPEAPKCLSWCRDTVCLGFKREYMLAKLTDAEPLKELFPTGKLMEPVIGRLNSEQLVVTKDENSVFIDCNGIPTYKQSFPWTDNPIYLESQSPFLLAILPKFVEVRTVEPKSLIQSIEVQRARFLCGWSDWMFVSSSTHIWLLQQRPISVQVDQLIRDREFELALRLTKISNEQNESEKMKQIRQIRTSLAFELFCQRRFEESLHIFADLETDPVQVIGLYPDLLPDAYQNKINYPSAPPTLSPDDMEQALNALIELLTDKRKLAQKAGAYIENTYPIVQGNMTVRAKRQLLQVIDTTLLKCYLKTNDALVAPLLRLPDNQCHVDVAEKELKKAGKKRELIELYKSKGLHRRALNVLLLQTETPNKVEAREDMIEYLQHIGREHIDLIFDFAPALLKADPTNAMKIFTADMAEVESLPKHDVYHFLGSISTSLLVAYLEHIIFALDEKTPEFHNRLALAYRDKVLSLMREYHDSLPEDEKSSDLSSAPLDLVETRKKLLSFLDHSKFYEPDRILHDFPLDKLIEERAMLLGKKGLHQQALALYTNTLKDNRLAEEFCKKVYQQNPTQENEIFLSLLKMYLKPSSQNAHSTVTGEVEASSIRHAVGILLRHANKIDAQKALELLPQSTSVSSIGGFLGSVLENLTVRLHHVQVLRSLLLSESQQVHEQRIFHEGQKCVIKEERVCKVCRKKIGVSAFARYPNDIVVHYYCCKDRKVAPPTG